MADKEEWVEEGKGDNQEGEGDVAEGEGNVD